MTFYNDTEANITLLASLFGFEREAVTAWLRCEGQEINNPSNPLNIRYYGRYPQLGQNPAGFAIYESPQAGLRDAYDMLARLAPLYGYQAILDQRDSGDAYAQARSIELSSWAAGHYGADESGKEGCLSSRIEPKVNAVKFVTLNGYNVNTGKRLRLRAGTRIYDLEGKYLWTYPNESSALAFGPSNDGSKLLVQINTARVYTDGKMRLTLLAVDAANAEVADYDYFAPVVKAAVDPLKAEIVSLGDALEEANDTATRAASALNTAKEISRSADVDIQAL